MKTHKFINSSLLALNLLLIFIVIFTQHWIFFQSFDPAYFKNFYDHSQWSIPSSTRIMGDGELYQYSGYRLLQGDHPFQINPEAPPFGKYLYAASIGLTGNAYLINLPLFFLSAYLVFAISRQLLKSQKLAYLASLLFIGSPAVFSQLGDTALDLVQLTTMLVFLWSLLKQSEFIPTPNLVLTLISGISLGLFIGTKVGLFGLALVIPIFLYFYKHRQISQAFAFVTIASLTYLTLYSQFFLQGHSLWDWLKNQKWILNFYLSSKAPRDPLVFPGTLLLGLFKWNSIWERVGEWTLLWPLGAAAFLTAPKSKFNSKLSIFWQTGAILGFIFLLVPFAVRYIILLVPFLIIFLLKLLAKLPKIIPVIITLVLLLQAGLYLFQAPVRAIDRLNSLLSANRFDDVYSQTLIEGVSRSDFSYQVHRLIYEMEADTANFHLEISSSSLSNSSLPIVFYSQYQTPIGSAEFNQPGSLIKHQGRWLLTWDWEYLAPHFTPTSQIELTKDPISPVKLITKDGKTLSWIGPVPQISIIPEIVTDEDELFSDLQFLTDLGADKIRVKLHVDYPPDLPRTIGYPKPGYDQNLLDKIATHSGVIVSLESRPAHRLYPSGVLNNNYLGPVKQIEKVTTELPHFLTGDITFINGENKYRIFDHPATPTPDIILDRTVNELLGADAEIVF